MAKNSKAKSALPVLVKQPDITIGNVYSTMKKCNVPESEIAYLYDMNHGMNMRTNEKLANVELVEELKRMIKEKKTTFKAELDASEAVLMLNQAKAEIQRLDIELNAIGSKFQGYLELKRANKEAGESVPEPILHLLEEYKK